MLTLPWLGFLEVFSLLHACMKRIHENTQLVDSTSIVWVLIVYTMKSLGVGGVVGIGEGVFHASSSDFFSFSCRNMRIYAPAGHFDPPPVLVGLRVSISSEKCSDKNIHCNMNEDKCRRFFAQKHKIEKKMNRGQPSPKSLCFGWRNAQSNKVMDTKIQFHVLENNP